MDKFPEILGESAKLNNQQIKRLTLTVYEHLMVTTISKSAILCLVPFNIWSGNPSIKEINAKIITPEILSHSIFKSPLFKLEV